jgi:peroxiredoxin Q/BCP
MTTGSKPAKKSAAAPAKKAAPAAKKAAPAAKKAAPAAAKKAAPAAAKKAAPAAAKKAAPAAKPEPAGGAAEVAPAFSLPADDGSTISLADFAGKRVVLYFYPKDNTPGCTREACDFRDNLDKVRAKGAVVLGVSRDSARSHAGFKTKYDLNFPLLVDSDAAVHRAYGAWGTKSMYGKTIEGALRTTVIIDSKGRIARRFPSVKVDGHAEAVLAALDSIT